ncbi:putative N-acetyltransferase YitI [Grifola frondosa]|uniref:Putative N-acetyltransferase YitI n=1 Tax=Grifola frondosa TaxID=5627 RepID=A0A1C7M5J4_GRIFR|nr:putative N-acetyltransferase YitI [Grifola frondosa]
MVTQCHGLKLVTICDNCHSHVLDSDDLDSGVCTQQTRDFWKWLATLAYVLPITADQTIPLRHSVLWPDHPVSHVLLPEDHSGCHYGAFLSARDIPVAVISVFKEPLPLTGTITPEIPAGTSAARFRKFACDPSFQGQGIGTKLLEHVFSIARSELKCDVVWCDARISAAGWYERRGMIRFGDTFYKGALESRRSQAIRIFLRRTC